MDKIKKIAVLYLYFFLFPFITIAGEEVTPPPFIGEVTPPAAWQKWLSVNDKAEQGGAIILFVNVLLRLVLVGAGLFSLWQIIHAGFIFISSKGDPQALSEARNKLIWTFIGLLVIFGSFVLIAIIGIIFFGDATIFITPEITGAP